MPSRRIRFRRRRRATGSLSWSSPLPNGQPTGPTCRAPTAWAAARHKASATPWAPRTAWEATAQTSPRPYHRAPAPKTPSRRTRCRHRHRRHRRRAMDLPLSWRSPPPNERPTVPTCRAPTGWPAARCRASALRQEPMASQEATAPTVPRPQHRNTRSDRTRYRQRKNPSRRTRCRHRRRTASPPLSWRSLPPSAQPIGPTCRAQTPWEAARYRASATRRSMPRRARGGAPSLAAWCSWRRACA